MKEGRESGLGREMDSTSSNAPCFNKELHKKKGVVTSIGYYTPPTTIKREKKKLDGREKRSMYIHNEPAGV